MRDRLLDVERAATETQNTCLAIVPVSRDACLRCGSELLTQIVRESALFWQTGYGATRQTTLRRCGECSYAFVSDITEVAPDRDERQIACSGR